MPPEQEINKALKTFSATKRGFVIFLVLALLAGTFLVGKYFRKQPVPDCTKCEEEKKVLVDVMLDIKRQMKPLVSDSISTTLILHNSGVTLLFPFIDTLPKKKVLKRKVPAQTQQQAQVTAKSVINKIDSIFRVIQQQQQQKPKN